MAREVSAGLVLDLMPEEALGALMQARGDQERLEAHRQSLSEYAITILRTKGELIRVNSCGYVEEGEGSSMTSGPGMLIAQATEPLAMGNGYVTLRDSIEDEHQDTKLVELAYVDDDNPWHFPSDGDLKVLATVGEGASPIDSSQETAVHSLITAIDASIALIPRLRSYYYLKDVMKDHRKGLPFWWEAQRHQAYRPNHQVYNIRENPEILRELYPDSDILTDEQVAA